MNVFVFCFGVSFTLLFLLGGIALIRFLVYRRQMTLAKQGLLPAKEPGRWNEIWLWGILLTVVGSILTLGLYWVGNSFRVPYPYGLGPWLLVGLLPLFAGLVLMLAAVLTSREPPERRN